MQQLDPISLPLQGVQLIEASAGTGKTYTIASLYLRLLLEPRGGARGEEGAETAPLTPEQILVVTFTRAATAELRDRIRRRIQAASLAFKLGKAGGDAVIQELLIAHQEQQPLVLKRLEAAERSMDEAAIFTIHGFCQRMLKNNAFESGEAFDLELVEDDTELKLRAAADFWRLAVYPQDAAKVAYLTHLLESPTALLKALSSLLNQKQIQVSPAPHPDTDVKQLVDLVCNQVIDSADDFKAQIETLSDEIEQDLIGLKVQAASVKRHLKILREWAATRQQQEFTVPDTVVKAHKYLWLDRIEKLSDAGIAIPQSIEQFDQAFRSWKAVVKRCPWLLSTAFSWICRQVERDKARLGLLCADDLLTDLHRALGHPELGPRLAAKVRLSYPVAMIDEFQDTDPLQYQIFTRLYSDQPDKALLMIGDPKQAIYGFRGADIFTYMQAKRAVNADQQHTLSCNYRSTQSLVSGVNALFHNAAAPFIFDQHIGFDAVASQHQDSAAGLKIDAQLQPALCFWQVPGDDHKPKDIQGLLNAKTAEQISQLLQASADGRATLLDKPISPGDIAILVRSRRQAEAVQASLACRNIRSAFLSRENVLDSPIASDLMQVLLAIHEPRNGRYLTAALAGQLVSWSAEQLLALREDEGQWQRPQQDFQRYHDLWLEKGVMAALRSWMQDYQVAYALLRDAETGERTLTDLQHLIELLQERSRTLQGAQALLHWYIEAISIERPENEHEQLRLESDQDLIQIVTIHRSKGLEYPIVFLPQAATYYAAREPLYHERMTDAQSAPQAHYDFFFDEASLALSEEERLAEDLRLLYVALTRAKCCCYVGISETEDRLEYSALGYLFAQNRQLAQNQQTAEEVDAGVDAAQAIAALQQQAGGLAIGLEQLTEVEQTWLASPTAPATPLAALPFTGRINDLWRTTSYSGLAKNHAQLSAPPGVADEPAEAPAAKGVTPAAGLQIRDRFSFPRGAKAGDFLHQVMEQQFFADNGAEDLAKAVSRNLYASGYQDPELWTPVVTDWLNEVLATPLRVPADAPFKLQGLQLDRLKMNQCLVEMEFHLPLARLQCQQLNRLLSAYPVVKTPTGGLRFNELEGMFKGFIDLVFEYDGRYYIADYKSNHLGNLTSLYRADTHLDAAMAEHRYDVQLLLYTLALHRFLGLQLGDSYRYEQHIGGGFYLFLRGMAGQPDTDTNVDTAGTSTDGAGQGSGVFYHRPEQGVIEALDRLFAGKAVDLTVQMEAF